MFDPGVAEALTASTTDVSAWSVTSLTSDLAADLFQASLVPYLAFLWCLKRPETKTPEGGFFGFAFLLVFVAATIPAGIIGAFLFLFLTCQFYIVIQSGIDRFVAPTPATTSAGSVGREAGNVLPRLVPYRILSAVGCCQLSRDIP